MGVLANHVPSIEQLKPGLVEVIEESGSNKQYFRTSSSSTTATATAAAAAATANVAISKYPLGLHEMF